MIPNVMYFPTSFFSIAIAVNPNHSTISSLNLSFTNMFCSVVTVTPSSTNKEDPLEFENWQDFVSIRKVVAVSKGCCSSFVPSDSASKVSTRLSMDTLASKLATCLQTGHGNMSPDSERIFLTHL